MIDDASTDRCCDRLPELVERVPQARLVLRRLARWSGIPFARNRGAEAATNPIYVITDANTRFLPNWDLPIWCHFCPGRVFAATIVDMQSAFGGFGCQLLLPSMSAAWLPAPGIYGGHVPVAACTGTVIDRSLFHHLRGYDEALPLYGAAEPEFSVRVWLSGYDVVNLPDLLIAHRFRPRPELNAFLRSIGPLHRRNYMRFACWYLPEELLTRTYQYYSGLAPEEFPTCMRDLEAEGVWDKRAELKRRLPLDFSSFAHRFGLAA